MSVLKLNDVSYRYDGTKNNVLSNVSFEFEKSMIYAVVGRSGAGKTTLLSLLSGLTRPKSGDILFNEKSISNINNYELRSDKVGVVFQSFNLLPGLTALENVVLSMDISRRKIKNKKAHAKELLDRVGLSEEEMTRRVLKLSGGQQQRVAIARALSCDPEVILADEPTGNLDLETQDEIMNIFKSLAHDDGKCIIIVTHSPNVSDMADKIYELIPLKRPGKNAG